MDPNGSMYTTLVTTQMKKIPIYGPTMYISVTLDYSPMFETIKRSPYNNSVVHPRVKRSIAIALFAILSSTPLSAVWAIQIENYGIGKGDTAKADITNAEIA